MDIIGRLKYIGQSFSFGLTDGKTYDCTEIDENGLLRIVDEDSWGESADGYLYSAISPGELDGSKKGIWEIIEDPTGMLSALFERNRQK